MYFLPGPMPIADSPAVRALVEKQDNDPLVDLDSLLFEESSEAARAVAQHFGGSPDVLFRRFRRDMVVLPGEDPVVGLSCGFPSELRIWGVARHPKSG
jgi:hypothetical protein